VIDARSLFLKRQGTRFTLTDQFDQKYTLGEHAGYVPLITCPRPGLLTDCLYSRSVAQVRSQLSPNAKIDIVAVAADPYHEDAGRRFALHRHFAICGVKNFYFVTGTRTQTSKVWATYGIGVTMTRTDAMSIHDGLTCTSTPRRAD